MKKLIAIFAAFIMVCTVVPVLGDMERHGDIPYDNHNKAYLPDGSQNPVNTYATISGGGAGKGGELNPVIKVKWEYDMDATCHDSDPCTEHLQVAPIIGQTATVGYFEVVTSPLGVDPNPSGLGYISVYADIWHPDGQYKYQIQLQVVGWDGNSYDKTAALNVWAHVIGHHQDLIRVNQNWTNSLPPGTSWQDDVYDELNEGLALLYFTTAEISYCQPGGYYLIGDTAFDKLGYQADYIYDDFWYIPTSAVQIDFSSVDYSPVHVGMHKYVGGDQDMLTPNKPTVRNIGNTPIRLNVWQDDMDFGMTSNHWNVQFDARLSPPGVNGDVIYYPYQNDPGCSGVWIPGVLPLCTQDKLDFSINVYKGSSGYTYTGLMKLFAFIDMDSYIWITPSQFVNQPPLGVPDYNLTRPIASFNYYPQNPKISDMIQFTDTSTDLFGIIVSWSWNFGDGATSTLRNPTHKYVDDGIYKVTLNITDDYGKKSTKSEFITVENVPPVADFTYSPLNPTTDNTIIFTDTSTDSDGTIVSWSWNFGDGTTSTLRNPTHKYIDDGEYTVILTISDDDGSTNVKSKSIPVDRGSSFSGLVADFTYLPLNPMTDDTITFTDASTDSTGIIVSWSWNFGDGATSTLKNPTHKYDNKGTYTVTLSVTDNNGATDVKSKSISVDTNVILSGPVADFTYSPLNPTTDDTIIFTDTSTDNYGIIVSWSWNFGDGATSNLRNPTHKYVDDGIYEVTLNVADNNGKNNAKSESITVKNVPPTADFTYDPTDPMTTDSIQFTDLSTDPDGSVVSWSWNFGDGITSTLQNPTHKYAAEGAYTVTLTVYDDDGAMNEISHAVHVGELVADFTYSPLNPTTNNTIVFTDTSTDADGTIVSWSWSFGDGTASTLQNPTYKYADEGIYKVTLNITDNHGKNSDKSEYITVENVPPVADFNYNPSNPKTTDAIQFTDLSTDSDGTIVSWFWSFGDEATSTIQNPTHKYAAEGAYTVTLKVTDDDGATNEISKAVHVGDLVADFTYSPLNPTTANTIIFTDMSTDADGTIVSWSWNFGDGATSNLRNPTHKYADDGIYEVTLNVADNNGKNNAKSESITVENVPPVAYFIYDPAKPKTTETIQFNDLSMDSDGTVVSWSWNFGDGATSTLQNPTHKYAAEGAYTVTLTVYDDDGAMNEISHAVHVGELVADFTYSTLKPTTNDTVVFTDTSTDTDGTIASWSWNFGDGTTSTLQNPTHRFSLTGDYSVILGVADDNSATDTETKIITISKTTSTSPLTPPPSPSPSGSSGSTGQDDQTGPLIGEVPKAEANGPYYGFVGTPITFNGTASNDSDGNITIYAWNFGDGTNGTGKIIAHTYSIVGNFTVMLTVTDDDGNNDTDATYANITERPNEKPTANFSYLPLNPTTDDTIQFTDLSTDSDGTIVSFSWNFSDGTYSSEKDPSHKYENAGAYAITLKVTDDDGATDTVSKAILVDNSHTIVIPGTAPGKSKGLLGSYGFDLIIIVIICAIILFLLLIRKRRKK